jgi:hypothetical protein
LHNFEFLLGKASGKYFMWAADDDRWESWFIERCVNALEQKGSSAAAAMTEVQYFTNAGLCEFFAEGAAFYDRPISSPLERVEFLLDHNYGNLFYSVFRRDVLLSDGQPLFSSLGLRSLNEIPILLQVAARGDWIVLPDVGMKKQTRMPTYRQARWERRGGLLPKECRADSLSSLRSLHKYHAEALREIRKSIDCLALHPREKARAKAKASRNIWRHFLSLAIGYKFR